LETPKIDIVVLTKNSDRLLRECLESVYANVPVNKLIVVDGYSTDKTLEILGEFKKKHGNVIVIRDKGTRATARYKGIRNVTTPWLMFVDSDVVLCKDWFKKANRYLQEDVGAVWGIEVWSTIRSPSMLKLFLWITRKIFDARGGTHDTLVRLDSVRDMQIPAKLHVFEDAYIKEWITEKGYKVIACYDPYCIHYRPQSVWTFKGSMNLVVDAFKFGSFKLVAKLILPYGFYTAYSIYQLLSNNMKRGQP
jgi:glycosyltransferase involved in cell wall biosynthesis